MLRFHEPLGRLSRWRLSLAGAAPRGAEWAVLVGFGVAATCAAVLPDLRLRLPGHAILRVILPFSLGLALVPRRQAGLVMGLAAATAAVGWNLAGANGLGVGATTSLLLTGPLLDLAATRARRGPRLFLAFALAGLVANLAAFSVRAGVKLAPLSEATGHPLAEWWSWALVSHLACGAAAGLFSAACGFHWRDRNLAADGA